MGSHTEPLSSSSPFLTLARPTATERLKTWTLSYPKWGTALTLADYLGREAYLTTVPLAKGDGITHWILTDSRLPPDARPILSACETLRKRAFIVLSTAGKERGGEGAGAGEVEEAIAHAIGSVFTDPEYRGRGYASCMMELVGTKLRTYQGRGMTHSEGKGEENNGKTGILPVALSVLFSDIGKKFYAAKGWAAFPSVHFSFTPQRILAHSPPARPIGYHELAELCALDEKMLKQNMAARENSSRSAHIVALAPDLDAMLWHMMREDFVTTRIFGKTPVVRGAIFGELGSRVWAIWTRAYANRPPKREGTLHILRVVIEDPSISAACLSVGVAAVIGMARHEAVEWETAHVELWNPTRQLTDLICGAGLDYHVVNRENDSIPSLRWYGDGSAEENVHWVVNEKYAWY